jgi:hypothetical protein
VNAAQDRDQIGYLPVQQHPLAGRPTASDARPLEFALGQGADVLELLAQVPPPAGSVARRRRLLGKLSQGG